MCVEGATTFTIFDPGGAGGAAAPSGVDHNPSDVDVVERILRMLRDDPFAIAEHWAEADPDASLSDALVPDDLNYDPAMDPRSTMEVDAEVDAYLADFKCNPIRDGVALRTMDPFLPDIAVTGDRIRHGGLTAELDRAIAAQMQRGCEPQVIADLLHGYPHLDSLLALKTHGLHYHMLPDFRPNGGDCFQQSRSYYRARPILHHSLTSMLAKGRAIAFPLDALSADDLASIHISELVHAPKAGSRGIGRTCLHLSRQKNPNYTAINAACDRAACDADNPPQPLPTLADFADIARAQRDAADGGSLESAYVDLTAAFQLIALDNASARLTATLLDIPRPGQSDLPVVMMWVVAEWGHTRTAHAFSILGNAIPFALQRDLVTPVTAIYVDDLPIVAPLGEAGDHLIRACEIAVTLLGPEALTLDDPSILSHFDRSEPFHFRTEDRDRVTGPKVAVRGPIHDAIGFMFDLERWRTYPRRKAVVKIYYLLWRAIPNSALQPDTAVSLPTRLLQTVASVLNFYSVSLPSGNACVRSLFSCIKTSAQRSPLTEAAKRDIAWWRVIIRDVAHEPYRLARNIDTLGDQPVVSRIVVSDASTGTGGGGWLAPPGVSRDAIPAIDTLRALIDTYIAVDSGVCDNSVQDPRDAVPALRAVPVGAWDTLCPEEVSLLDMALRTRPIRSSDSRLDTDLPRIPHGMMRLLQPIAAVIRWTAGEFAEFDRAGVGINVLEYFSAAYLVLLWGPTLHGQSVGICVDNTAALAWLAKGRYNGISDSGRDLLQIFYMYCVAARITLVPTHISGVARRPLGGPAPRTARSSDRYVCAAGPYRGALVVARAIANPTLSAALDASVQAAIQSSAALSTRNTQASAWNAWRRFCLVLHLREDLRPDRDMAFEPLEETITIVGRFAAFEIARGMSPQSLQKTYFSAIARDFDDRRVRNNFRAATNSRDIKKLLDGFLRVYYKDGAAAQRRRLAFTAELQPGVVDACDKAFGSDRDIALRLAEPLSIKLGMWFCLRKSEFVPSNKNGQGTLGLPLNCITFNDAAGNVLPFADIAHGAASRVTINIRYSKTDQHGIGRIRQMSAAPAGQSCLVRDLELYMVLLRDVYAADPATDYIFAIGGRPIISGLHLAQVIRVTVIAAGMDPTRYTPHSLRYGGATMLAAAGLPLYLIEYHGGWAANSASIRNYLQIGGATSAAVIAGIMSDRELRGLEDVRLEHYLRTPAAPTA